MKVTMWINYGSEGWKPKDYESVDEALVDVFDGRTHGQQWRLTAEITLAAVEPGGTVIREAP